MGRGSSPCASPVRATAFLAHCSLCVCSRLSSHLCHLLLGPAEPSWALSPNHDPHSTLMTVSSLHSLLGFSLSHLSKGLNLGGFYPRRRRLFGRRKNGGPGTSSSPWVLQIRWLLLDGGDLALCRKEDRGPHPHPSAGHPWQETGDPLSPTYSRPQCQLLSRRRRVTLPAEHRGRSREFPCLESPSGAPENSPCKGRAELTTSLHSPLAKALVP